MSAHKQYGISNFQECSETRAKIFELLIEHCEQGYSLDSFRYFNKFKIEQILNDYPEEWNKTALEEAVRVGQLNWEIIGKKQSDGSCNGNSRAWVYNMINRYNWTDRTKVEQSVTGGLTVNVVKYGDAEGG